MVASLDTTRHFVAPEPVPPNEHLVGRGTPRFHPAPCIPAGNSAGRGCGDHPADRQCPGGTNQHHRSESQRSRAGNRSANLGWRRTPDDTVLFNPLRTYHRSEEMELYYEIEGLKSGPLYRGAGRQEARLRRRHLQARFRRGRGGHRLKFEEQATTPRGEHPPEAPARAGSSPATTCSAAGGGCRRAEDVGARNFRCVERRTVRSGEAGGDAGKQEVVTRVQKGPSSESASGPSRMLLLLPCCPASSLPTSARRPDATASESAAAEPGSRP